MGEVEGDIEAVVVLNKGILLARRGMVFDACIRSVMLYGGETWALTKKL